MSLESDVVHDQIAELRVFGSVARGEDRPDSDVDLVPKNSLHWMIRDQLRRTVPGRAVAPDH